MLMGEHAVLRHQPALCAALDQRLTVTLLPQETDRIRIQSILGHYDSTRDDLKVQPPFEFVLTIIKQLEPLLPSGFDLHITSQFSSTVGFGSSSAVTVATLAALSEWLKLPTDPMSIFETARGVIQNVQGVGSGADVAASTFGGIVFYEMEPAKVEPIELEKLPAIQLIYSGSKMRTAFVVENINQRYQESPEALHELFLDIGDCVHQAKDALLMNDMDTFHGLVNKHRALMTKMGLNNQPIDSIFESLGDHPAKISGSGLGDCVIAFGETEGFPRNDEQAQLGIKSINAKLARRGLTITSQP